MNDRTASAAKKGRKNQPPASGGRDDRLDDELDRERRQPGLSSGGDGDAGADSARSRSDGNSNT